ncbi:Uncharacterised protein [Legionella sainthelensi]|nr:Uncharacterised protein [Legionella sainthelensi]
MINIWSDHYAICLTQISLLDKLVKQMAKVFNKLQGIF